MVTPALDPGSRMTPALEQRTPFATIRTQAQIAQRSSDPVERRQALYNLILGVDRATRLIANS